MSEKEGRWLAINIREVSRLIPSNEACERLKIHPESVTFDFLYQVESLLGQGIYIAMYHNTNDVEAFIAKSPQEATDHFRGVANKEKGFVKTASLADFNSYLKGMF